MKTKSLGVGAGHARDFCEDDILRVNAFDWNREFADIMKDGGFDAVIGNPPYVNVASKSEQNYFLMRYKYQNFQYDLYLLFLERYEFLLKNNGLLGVIVSNTWLQSILFKNIRKHLASNYCWCRVLYLPEKVFKAVVDTHVLIFEKEREASPHKELTVDIRKNGIIAELHKLKQSNIAKNGDAINIVVSTKGQELFKRLTEKSITLASVCKVYNGVKPFEKGKGTPPQDEKVMKDKPFVETVENPGENWSPLLRGSLIRRYINLWDRNYWIQYGEWLAAPRDPKIFQAPLKIAVRQTGDSIIATMVEGGFIMRDNLHIISRIPANSQQPSKKRGYTLFKKPDMEADAML